ncbi:hypothetical protein MKW92_014146 [Papaver armeniacum]|nr:hypothetical protein MKW92_014146 [Papaver armeniacum]
MLEGMKLIGDGAATIALAGAAIGIGNIFSYLIQSVARNPSVAKQLFGYAILGGSCLCLITDLNLPPELEEDVPILEGRPVYIPEGVANELSRLHKTILRERRQIDENEAKLARTAEKIRNAPMERKAWWDELERWFRDEDSD